MSRYFNLKSFYFNLNSFYFNLRVKRCSPPQRIPTHRGGFVRKVSVATYERKLNHLNFVNTRVKSCTSLWFPNWYRLKTSIDNSGLVWIKVKKKRRCIFYQSLLVHQCLGMAVYIWPVTACTVSVLLVDHDNWHAYTAGICMIDAVLCCQYRPSRTSISNYKYTPNSHMQPYCYVFCKQSNSQSLHTFT